MKFFAQPLTPWKDLLLHLAAWVAMLSLPSMYFSFFPLPAFDETLDRLYPDQSIIVLSGRHGFSGENTFNRRTYLLFPSVFTDPKFIELRQRNSDAPTVREERSSFRAFLAVFVVLCVIYFGRRWRSRPEDA